MADHQNQNKHQQQENGADSHLPGQYAGMGPERPEQMGAERRIIEQTREGAYLAIHDIGNAADPNAMLAPRAPFGEPDVMARELSTRERLVEGVGIQDIHDQVLVARVNDILRARIAEVLERPRGPIEIVRHAFSNQRRRLVELLEGDLAAKQASAAALGVVRGVDWAEVVDRSVRQAREEIFHRSINDVERLQTNINGLPDNITTLLTQLLGRNYGAFQGLEINDHAKILARKLYAMHQANAPELETRLRTIRRDLPKQPEESNPKQVQLINDAKAAMSELPGLISDIQAGTPQLAPLTTDIQNLEQRANLSAQARQRLENMEDRLAQCNTDIVDCDRLFGLPTAEIQQQLANARTDIPTIQDQITAIEVRANTAEQQQLDLLRRTLRNTQNLVRLLQMQNNDRRRHLQALKDERERLTRDIRELHQRAGLSQDDAQRLTSLRSKRNELEEKLNTKRQEILTNAKLIAAHLRHIMNTNARDIANHHYLNWIVNTLSTTDLQNIDNVIITTPIPAKNAAAGIRAIPEGRFDREKLLAANTELETMLESLPANQPTTYFDLLFKLQMNEYEGDIHNVEQRRRASLAEIFFQEQLLKNDATRSAGNRERSRMAERRGQGIGGWFINQLEHSFAKRTLERVTTNYYNAEETFQHLLPDFDPEFRTWLGKVHKSGLNISHRRLREFSQNDPNFDHKKLFKFAMRMGQVVSGLEIGGQRRIQVRPEDVPLIERFIEQAQRLYTEVEATNALAKFDRPSDPEARDKNHAEYLSKVLYEANRARDEFEKQVRRELVEPASEWRNWFRKSFYMEKLKEAKAQAKEQGLTPAQTREYLKNEALYNLGSPARKQMRKALSYAKSFLFRAKQVGGGIATGATYGYKGAKWGVEKGAAGVRAVGRGIKYTAGKGVEATKWTLKAPFRGLWWGIRAPFRALRFGAKKAQEVVAPAVQQVKEGITELAQGTGFVAGGVTGGALRTAVFPFECMQAAGAGVVGGFKAGFGTPSFAAGGHGGHGEHGGGHGGGAHGGGGPGAPAPAAKPPADEAD